MKQKMTEPYQQDAQIYEIRLKGYLDNRWARLFDDLAISREENGNTLLKGRIADQAALYGLLKNVRDIGMQLLSVNVVKQYDGEVETKKEQENSNSK